MLWVLLLDSGVYAKSAEGGGWAVVPFRGDPKRWQSLILGGACQQQRRPTPNSAKGLSSGNDHVKQFLEASDFEIV